MISRSSRNFFISMGILATWSDRLLLYNSFQPFYCYVFTSFNALSSLLSSGTITVSLVAGDIILVWLGTAKLSLLRRAVWANHRRDLAGTFIHICALTDAAKDKQRRWVTAIGLRREKERMRTHEELEISTNHLQLTGLGIAYIWYRLTVGLRQRQLYYNYYVIR